MASESGLGQTGGSNISGVTDSNRKEVFYKNGMGRPARECESHVFERKLLDSWIQSTAGHEESRGKSGGPPSKPKYYLMTDRGAVP